MTTQIFNPVPLSTTTLVDFPGAVITEEEYNLINRLFDAERNLNDAIEKAREHQVNLECDYAAARTVIADADPSRPEIANAKLYALRESAKREAGLIAYYSVIVATRNDILIDLRRQLKDFNESRE